MIQPLRGPLFRRLPTRYIIAQTLVKINKNVSEIEKLVVQYHGRQLMNWCVSVLNYKRTLGTEGIAALPGGFSVKQGFYFQKKSVFSDVTKKYYLLDLLCAL